MPRNRTQQLELPSTDNAEAMSVGTLRPGVLVALKTSVTGNTKINKEIIEEEHRIRNGASKTVVKIERIISDPDEHKKANQVRMKCRAIICSVCSHSNFGLLCPEDQLDKLALALREAERHCQAFNRTARLTRVQVYTITGRVAQDDREAVRAIKSEVRDLMNAMSEGVKNLDAKKIRDAANKIKSLGMMLSPAAAEQAKTALEAARGAARKIVKAGEEAAQEVDRAALNAINAARTAFVDVEEGETELEDVVSEAPGVDFDPEASAIAENDTANDNAETAPRPRVRKPKKAVAKKTAKKRRAPAEARAGA